MEEVLSVPSNVLFSPYKCRTAFKKILKIVHIPFTLGDKKISWIGIHESSNREGDPVRVDFDFKSLVNLQELVSEVVGYVKKTRHNHLLPLERMCMELRINKIIAQPASVLATWENWLENRWDEYLEFVRKKPMRYLRRRWMKTVLERRRQSEGEFDPKEICAICKEGLSENDCGGGVVAATTRLECSHVYHESCISGWFVAKNTCPCCRALAR